MRLVAFQLGGRYSGTGMGDHEPEVSRQTGCRNPNHVHAVQHGDDALQAQVVANVGFHGDVCTLLHQGVSGRSDHQNAASLGDHGIVQDFGTLEDFLVDVGLGQLQGVGLGTSACGHHAVNVGVHFGNDDFPLLSGQGGSSRQLVAGLVLIQAVDGEGEAAVFAQGHGLGGGVQASHSAVTAPVAVVGALSVVVVHLAGADLVDLHSVGTVPPEVLVGQQGFLAFFIEHFIHIGKKLGSQINRQLCSILSCKSVTNTITAREARSTDTTRGVPAECVPHAFGQSVLERLDNGGVGLVKRFLVLVIEALGQGRRETVSNQLVLGVGSQFTLENVSFPLIEFRRQLGADRLREFAALSCDLTGKDAV